MFMQKANLLVGLETDKYLNVALKDDNYSSFIYTLIQYLVIDGIFISLMLAYKSFLEHKHENPSAL